MSQQILRLIFVGDFLGNTLGINIWGREGKGREGMEKEGKRREEERREKRRREERKGRKKYLKK